MLERLRQRGITMLYVSHRLEEVFAISDRVTITRNGRDVLTKDRAALTMPEVIEGMIGAQPESMFPPPRSGEGRATGEKRSSSAG